MKYAVVVLVNDMVFFNTMLKNMPEQTNSDLIVVNETRIGDLESDIKRCLRKNKKEALVLTAGKINNYICDALNLSSGARSFVASYTMGMNINTQYYILSHSTSPYERILFIDDDVLINKDLGAIIEKYDYAFYKNRLGYKIGGNSSYDKQLLEFYGGDLETWRRNHFNSGHRIYSKGIVSHYKKALELFYDESEFQFAWAQYVAGVRGFKTKAFFLDMNFENCVAHRAGVINNKLGQNVRILNGPHYPKNLSILLDRELLHYAVGGRGVKMQFLRMMKKEGLLK